MVLNLMSASVVEIRTDLVGIPRVGKIEGGGVDPGPGPELAPQENKVFFVMCGSFHHRRQLFMHPTNGKRRKKKIGRLFQRKKGQCLHCSPFLPLIFLPFYFFLFLPLLGKHDAPS